MTETIDIWRGQTALYNEVRPHTPGVLLDLCLRLARMQQSPVVVDLGSGTGLSSLPWAERAQLVIGIEPSAYMRAQAERQRDLLPQRARVQFRNGRSTQTGLDTGSVDIVTCSQSLHWMEPAPTFAEVARILRPGGLFVAYDHDWPPTIYWEVEQAYRDVIARSRRIRTERAIDSKIHFWSKEQHLTRMRASGKFRYVRELAVHHTEEGNAERFIGLILSRGIGRYLQDGYFTEQEIGLDHLKCLAYELIGREPVPWHFSYSVKVGIK